MSRGAGRKTLGERFEDSKVSTNNSSHRVLLTVSGYYSNSRQVSDSLSLKAQGKPETSSRISVRIVSSYDDCRRKCRRCLKVWRVSRGGSHCSVEI